MLVNCDTGLEENLLKELKGIREVTEAYVVYGVYDIILKIEGDDMSQVKEAVAWRIRRYYAERQLLECSICSRILASSDQATLLRTLEGYPRETLTHVVVHFRTAWYSRGNLRSTLTLIAT